MELIKYEAAKKALAEAHSIDEVKKIRDKAEALRLYTKQAGDLAMVNMASEIKIRAERKAGQFLKELGFGDQGGDQASRSVKLADLGLDKNQSFRYQQIAVVTGILFAN